MQVELKLPKHPNRLDAKNPRLIEDLLEIASTNQAAVDAIIKMCEDLHQNGHQCIYAEKLKNLPLWELKTHARGQAKGGARVYFYFLNGNAVLCNAEDKSGNKPNKRKLDEVAEIMTADLDGIPLY